MVAQHRGAVGKRIPARAAHRRIDATDYADHLDPPSRHRARTVVAGSSLVAGLLFGTGMASARHLGPGCRNGRLRQPCLGGRRRANSERAVDHAGRGTRDGVAGVDISGPSRSDRKRARLRKFLTQIARTVLVRGRSCVRRVGRPVDHPVATPSAASSSSTISSSGAFMPSAQAVRNVSASSAPASRATCSGIRPESCWCQARGRCRPRGGRRPQRR